MTRMFAVVFGLSFVCSAVIGCAPLDDAEYVEGELTSATTLYYEGSCSFLMSCSFPSRSAGHVLFGCSNIVPSLSSRTCSDSDRWVAAPSTEYCGLPVRICRGSTCVEAEAYDLSNRGVWEGGPAVVSGLGFTRSETLSPTCAGSGGGPVTMQTGYWDSYSSPTLTVGEARVVYFDPARVGTHAIEFLNEGSLPSAGTIEYCWRSGTTTTSWSCWTTDTNRVTNQTRRTRLWSGSTTINYRITIRNTSARPARFWWRFYHAW